MLNCLKIFKNFGNKKFFHLNTVKNFARFTNYKSETLNNTKANGNNKEESVIEVIEQERTNKTFSKKTKKPAKTINIEETTSESIKIAPYFSDAVNIKDKSHTHVSLSSLIEDKRTKSKGAQKEEERRQSQKKKKVILENIKRELPSEL
jgi:hypothetical protein